MLLKEKEIVLAFLHFVLHLRTQVDTVLLWTSLCTHQCFIHTMGNSELDWNRIAVCAFILSLLHMSSFPSAASSFVAEHLLLWRTAEENYLQKGMISCQICVRKHVGSLKLFLFQNQLVLCSSGHSLCCVLCSVATVDDRINLCVLLVTVDLMPEMHVSEYVQEWPELSIWEEFGFFNRNNEEEICS